MYLQIGHWRLYIINPLLNHWWKLAFVHYHDTIIPFLYRSVYSYRLKRVKTNDFSVKSGIYTSTIIRSIKHYWLHLSAKLKIISFIYLCIFIQSCFIKFNCIRPQKTLKRIFIAVWGDGQWVDLPNQDRIVNSSLYCTNWVVNIYPKIKYQMKFNAKGTMWVIGII